MPVRLDHSSADFARQFAGFLGAKREVKTSQPIYNAQGVKLLEGGYPEVGRIIHGHPTLSEGVMEAARAADGWLVHG